jgi:hypothetical protein
MRRRCASSLLGIALLCTVGCGGASSSGSGGGSRSGQATVTIGGKSFAVGDVLMSYETGDGGYFRIEGSDAAHPSQDCLPGLGGGLAIYGDLPAEITSVAQLSGQELPFEFSGDGDDFNLCFVGSNGLLGVERGTVRFTVNGNQVTFTFSGRFTTYDGEGGKSASPVDASGSGSATLAS